MITFIVLWFLVGFFGMLVACWIAGGSILVRDLIFSILYSFCGPVSIVFIVLTFFLYADDNKWLDKKIL